MRTSPNWHVVFVTCLLALGLVGALEARGDALDDGVRAAMRERHVPGLAYAVIRDGRVVRQGSFGLANVELRVPVTPHTSFEIASMSKQFAAAAVLLLVEDGRIGLDDSVTRYLPDAPPAWRAITIRRLLDHTSGLPDDFDEDDAYFQTRITHADFLHSLEAAPLRFEPGTAFRYSCGPFVAGLVVEAVTGRPYRAFFADRIARLLGLAETSVNDASALVPQRAAGYDLHGDTLVNGRRISAAAESRADVGVRTTLHDLVRWDAALSTPGFLRRQSLDAMFGPSTIRSGRVVPYALGWFITPWRGHRVAGHGGAFRTGYSSEIDRYLDDDLTIIVLTNLRAAHPYVIARLIASHFLAGCEPIRGLRARIDVHPRRTAGVRAVMDSLARGALDPEALAGRYHEAFDTGDELREALRGLRAVTYVDSVAMKRPAPNLYGSMIAWTGLYRVDAEVESDWSVAFTRDGSIVAIERE